MAKRIYDSDEKIQRQRCRKRLSYSSSGSGSQIINEPSTGLQDIVYDSEILKQHRPMYISNPSDESDFSDLTYQTHLNLDESKTQRQLRTKISLELSNTAREQLACSYYQKHIFDPESFFCYPGVTCSTYTHEAINFRFHPNEVNRFLNRFRRVYRVKLVFENMNWKIKRVVGPEKEQIYKLFQAAVSDEDLPMVLCRICDIFLEFTHEQVTRLKVVQQKFLDGEDVYVASEEEEIIFDEEQRLARKEKRDLIWDRLKLPDESYYKEMRIE